VVAQAVGLDHEAQVGPIEIDFPAVDDLFAERERESGFGGDRAKEDLQVRVGEAKRPLVEKLA